MTDRFSLFPPDFVWGAATSAYQIEGSPLADGAGPSNWHLFCRQPGAIDNGDTGDVACDHYRRYADDVRLMKRLGLQAYRFSVSWSRIFPEGRGKLNPKGLAFYQRLVEALNEAGIEPYLTLYHWDLPAALDDLGGWVNRDCAAWFADYAHVLMRELGGEVKHWITLNEPWVAVDGGYVHGVHAPGHASLAEAPHAAHNLLRGHALAVQAFRADGEGQIGLVVNLEPKYTASDKAEDKAAAARAHAYMNRQFLDPVLLGSYPEELAEIYGSHWPRFDEADMKLLREPFDFLGINYYTRSVNRADPQALPVGASPVRQPGATYTEMDWEVFPSGLQETLEWVKRRYGDIPLYVTENGAAMADPPPEDGRLQDDDRIDYFRTHLLAARAAMEEGVDLRGYFAWSLLDNFEWSCGYAKRFGLVHVDRATQVRTPKASAHFYSEVIATRGAVLRS
ncbi:GH1 family beta-glucosidase [Methylococcus sp. EFPC2]|uniref:GH1 family beta-glucosidase n=1 Tax=Methylococcus sp. EFPC2 TaxID=2812648 RepID=UPI0019679F2E|nr:GH1 family beta-glucosidase [Methylococcus sp. EFPC2]QSA97045.1 beta-glucosidase [Methylococcus sp. EFPC2]